MGIHIVRVALHGSQELPVGRDHILLRERDETKPVVERRRVGTKLDRVLTDNPRQLNAAQVEVDARQVGIGVGAQRLTGKCKPKEDDGLLGRLGIALACSQKLLPLQNRKVDVATRLVLTRRNAVAKHPLCAGRVALFQLEVALVGLATHELRVDCLRPREGIRGRRRIALLGEHQTKVEPAVRIPGVQFHRGSECRLCPLQTALIGLVCVGVKGGLTRRLEGLHPLRLDLFGALHPFNHRRARIAGLLYLHLLGSAAGR